MVVGSRDAVLGIDLGTSQVKALVMAPDGEVLGRGRAGYPVSVPAEGHAETDPEEWWRATTAAVREALADAADGGRGHGADGGRGTAELGGGIEGGGIEGGGIEGGGIEGGGIEVAGVGLAGQMHGVVLAEGDGTPVRPAILWLDRRAGAEAAGYGTLPRELTAPLGNQASAGMAGPILCWLAGHEADAVRRARWALQPKDWLRLRLTGRAATDPTDASGTLLFDLPRDAWAGDLIGALGLPAEKLPEISEPAAIAGPLLAGPARELGLPAGIPVAIGAADTAAALHSAGQDCVAPESAAPGAGAHGGERWALLTLGTGGQWVVPAGSFLPTENTNLFRAAGGGFYRLAPAQNVGVALDWVRNLLGASWQQLYDTAARPWRPDTPLFLPYLAQERWDRAMTGTWTGLSLAHQRDDLLRGALEGVAFLLRRRLDDLRAAGHDPRDVIIGGGGTSHPAWRQLLADALGLPLRPAATTWLSATGAARIAAAAAGMSGGGGSRFRSGCEKTELVVPGQLNAAGAGYDRFTHKLTVPEIGVIMA